jgi:hypothetical protein
VTRPIEQRIQRQRPSQSIATRDVFERSDLETIQATNKDSMNIPGWSLDLVDFDTGGDPNRKHRSLSEA